MVASMEKEQPERMLTLHMQRMNALRLTLSVSANASVEELRELIRQQTEISPDRQRIIFRGSVLKNGRPLSAYGVENESVLHLVERVDLPSDAFNASGNAHPNAHPSAHPSANSTTDPAEIHRRNVGAAAANILFHTMQIDPSAGANNIAQDMTRSIMGALRTFMGDDSNVGNASSGVGNNSAGSSDGSGRGEGREGVRTNMPIFSNATSGADGRAANTRTTFETSFTSDGPFITSHSNNPSATLHAFTSSNPPAVSTNTGAFIGIRPAVDMNMSSRQSIAALTNDLDHLTTFADGSDLFPTSRSPNSAINSTHNDDALGALHQNFQSFERAYWMMASACRELSSGLGDNGRIPWDRFVNFMSLLDSMPNLMATQRSILSQIRARRDGSAEFVVNRRDIDTSEGLVQPNCPADASQPGNNTYSSPAMSFDDIIDPPE